MTATAEKVKHTPGPWVRGLDCTNDIYNIGPGSELLASAYPMKRDGLFESWKANATLIAAAPQLLDALERIADADPKGIACREGCACMGCIARAAIRKAKGGGPHERAR